MKKLVFGVLFAALLCLTACGGESEKTELVVFAASSLTETMDEIIEAYKTVAPDVVVVPTYDSSGTLLDQIEAGAECDLFISAAQKQMDALEAQNGLLAGSRVDLLENNVVLVVPAEGRGDIESFDRLAQLLNNGDVFMAMGNSDVPVGQYTQKIFAYYGLDEATLAAAGVLTYGSNAKEVVTQVREGVVDCGVVYATDAVSGGLTVVDAADAEMCGRVTYPAAVIGASARADEACALMEYLRSGAAMEIFASVGFSPAG